MQNMLKDAEIRKTIDHGSAGVFRAGHRMYVGGQWERIGRLQFAFLRNRAGLRPDHRVLDIGCGALRLGVHVIRFLEPGGYMGVEKEPELIRLGIERELGHDLYEQKRPALIVSADFEFDRLPAKPDIAWAHSLFTHLTPDRISLCLRNLRAWIEPTGVLFATFFEAFGPRANPTVSHDQRRFAYTRRQMEAAAEQAGWRVSYIGKWGHPRGQRMLRFEPKA
ncbi:MAG: hypothetical protein AMXMBFR81_31490 [Chthonomonas sp.]